MIIKHCKPDALPHVKPFSSRCVFSTCKQTVSRPYFQGSAWYSIYLPNLNMCDNVMSTSIHLSRQWSGYMLYNIIFHIPRVLIQHANICNYLTNLLSHLRWQWEHNYHEACNPCHARTHARTHASTHARTHISALPCFISHTRTRTRTHTHRSCRLVAF